MKNFLKLIFLLIVTLYLIFLVIDNQPEGVYYNCGMAEISPDIPLEVKEQCRKLRMEQNKTTTQTTI